LRSGWGVEAFVMSTISEEPIKFRCYRCNKLLGVPARKVGSTVACPQCKAELQVPRLESATEPTGLNLGVDTSPAPAPALSTGPDRVAFPEVFTAASTPPAPSPALDDSPIAAISVEAPSIRGRDAADRPAHDVVLSPLVVLAWSLLVLMAVPLAFIAGLLTGHFVWK
jgi:phage FluMu protein Com